METEPVSIETASKGTGVQVKSYPPAWLASGVWGIGAVFYLAVFFLRAAPAVMTAELMRDFHIGAASLGNLSAFYFYFYVAMQIPVGALTNSWGARKLLVYGAASAAAGQFLFGVTSNITIACVGRAIIGGSTAVGWLVVLRLAAHWFPRHRFGMISGLGLFFGNLGALFAQVPLRLAVEAFGWRATAIGSAGVILGIGLLAWAVVRDDPAQKGLESYAPPALQSQDRTTLGGILRSVRSVFSYRNTWLILLAQGGMVGPIMTFTGLWGAPFLRARYGLDPKAAATLCSVMIIFWAVASPVFGALSDRLGKRKPAYLGGAAICGLGWLAMIYLPNLPLPVFTIIASVTSFATGCVIIGFAFGRESVPTRHMGAVTATTNIGNMLGNVLLQPGIGLLLDRNWSGAVVHGARIYSVEAYRIGFLPIIAWVFLSGFLILFTRETSCRQAVTEA
ncbi:MAG TPA: MFS transporter [Verrucomicrobiae bacterium]|nr:MFS transporter [Verrucomicrobiae bacterium]